MDTISFPPILFLRSTSSQINITLERMPKRSAILGNDGANGRPSASQRTKLRSLRSNELCFLGVLFLLRHHRNLHIDTHTNIMIQTSHQDSFLGITVIRLPTCGEDGSEPGSNTSQKANPGNSHKGLAGPCATASTALNRRNVPVMYLSQQDRNKQLSSIQFSTKMTTTDQHSPSSRLRGKKETRRGGKQSSNQPINIQH